MGKSKSKTLQTFKHLRWIFKWYKTCLMMSTKHGKMQNISSIYWYYCKYAW